MGCLSRDDDVCAGGGRTPNIMGNPVKINFWHACCGPFIAFVQICIPVCQGCQEVICPFIAMHFWIVFIELWERFDRVISCNGLIFPYYMYLFGQGVFFSLILVGTGYFVIYAVVPFVKDIFEAFHRYTLPSEYIEYKHTNRIMFPTNDYPRTQYPNQPFKNSQYPYSSSLTTYNHCNEFYKCLSIIELWFLCSIFYYVLTSRQK